MSNKKDYTISFLELTHDSAKIYIATKMCMKIRIMLNNLNVQCYKKIQD